MIIIVKCVVRPFIFTFVKLLVFSKHLRVPLFVCTYRCVQYVNLCIFDIEKIKYNSSHTLTIGKS